MPSTPPKWALITGVSPAGMGEAHCHAFLERGVNVVATALDVKLLEHLNPGELKDKYGSKAVLVRQELDVTDPQSIARAVDRLRHVIGGRLDFLISEFCLVQCVS